MFHNRNNRALSAAENAGWSRAKDDEHEDDSQRDALLRDPGARPSDNAELKKRDRPDLLPEHVTNYQDIVPETLVANPMQLGRLLKSLDAGTPEAWFITAR
jgi:hypothetical protein